MAKELELIYSQQATGFIPGRAYSNPRFFTSPRSGVSKVYLVGDWPMIRAAYENLGVEVERLDASTAEGCAAPTHIAPPPAPVEDPGSAVIPDGWRDLPWSKPGPDGLTIRAVAKSVCAEPSLNKAAAIETIETELARRAAVEAPVNPLDVPQPEALGLTLRELHADLTALGIQWDADATPAQLLAERDEARMLAEAG